MKRLIIAVFCIVVCSCARAAGADGIKIELQPLVSALSFNFDGGNFLGELNLRLRGLAGGDITVVIEGASGKQVFRDIYPCGDSYLEDEVPTCSMSSLERKNPAPPYEVAGGKHVLRLLADGNEIYSLSFDFRVKDEDGYKRVYVTGGWAGMALLRLSSSPAVNVEVYSGGPDSCGGEGVNAQVQLFRNGQLFARGHMEGILYEGCSTGPTRFALFSETEDHFTRWTALEDILAGDYELIYFKDGSPAKTFSFSVAEGTLYTAAPAGTDSGLLPGALYLYPPDSWIYAK